MRFTVRGMPVSPWWLVVLFAAGLGCTASAQDRQERLRNHARVVLDSCLTESDRTAHARAFMIAARPEDWPLAFETIRDVAHHRDQLEVKLVESARALLSPDDPRGTRRLIPARERERKKHDEERRRKTLERALRADDAVLDVFRSNLTQNAARSDPATFAEFVAGLGRPRDAVERAKNVRALGFFPTPAARQAVLAHLTDSDVRVVLAAVRAVANHADAATRAPAADSPWPDAFERLQSGLARAWHDRDVKYRRYRVAARKSAAMINQLNAVNLKDLEDLKTILEDALAAVRSAKSAKEVKDKYSPRKEKRLTLKAALDKTREKHEEAGRLLRARDRTIRAFLATAGRVFDRLSAEQRTPIEASLAGRLADASYQPSCLRLIELCGRLRSDAIGQALVLATAAPAPEARVAACLALGRPDRSAHVLPLSARLGDPCWQVESAAIRALRTIGGRKAVDALLTAVTVTDGCVRERANDALRELTGEDFHGDAVRWSKWWERYGEGYEGPPRRHGKQKAERPPSQRDNAESDPDAVDYFGIRTRSRRIAFVLDTSGVMGLAAGPQKIVIGGEEKAPTWRRIDQAVDALKDAISTLPEDAVFNVLLYGDKVTSWKRELAPADGRNKKAAQKWLARAKPAGGAAVFDALVRALDPASREARPRLRPTIPDTIFLLAGGWTGGRELAVEVDVVEEVERINRLAQVVIHTISVGEDAPADFLHTLASRCGGRFVDATGRRAKD